MFPLSGRRPRGSDSEVCLPLACHDGNAPPADGILLVNHCQHLEKVEGEPFGPALVLRGARERLLPILMTTLATGLRRYRVRSMVRGR